MHPLGMELAERFHHHAGIDFEHLPASVDADDVDRGEADTDHLRGGGRKRHAALAYRAAVEQHRGRAGIEIVICHPKLVETGLDLLAFPTLYFYETGYSLHTLRQASPRSRRIGQKLPVRVKFLAYRGTMQEACIRHMGKKMLVALMMEGKFSGEGLQSLDADEDMLTALARELVEKGRVGESAEAVWRDLGRERSKHTAEQPPLVEVSTVPPSVSVKVAEESSVIAVETSFPNAGGLQLVQPSITRRKRKASQLWPTAHTVGEQLSLFG